MIATHKAQCYNYFMNFCLKHYAHIGDAVWELFIREDVIYHTSNQRQMHNLTTKFVNAEFQSEILDKMSDFFTDEENELIRRGRNLPLTVAKRNNPQTHRNATSLEVITGYFYLNDKKRLEEFFKNIKKNLKI